LCAVWISDKLRLFPYTASTDWFLYQRFNTSQPSGYYEYIYRQFNTQQFYVLPTQCIYVFYMDLRTKSYISLYSINWLVFVPEI